MTASRLERLRAAPLYLICSLGPQHSRDLALHHLISTTESGARLVQLRDKQASTAERCEWLARCRGALEDDVLIVVNDDLDAVLEPGQPQLADGVHLGREDAAALADPEPEPPGADPADPQRLAAGLRIARERLGPELLLGTSTRTLAEVSAARAAGCDYVGFGAMAATDSKSGTTRADPTELARAIAEHPDFPIFPIGGLGPDNLQLVLDVGCRRAAIGAAIFAADDAADVAADCIERLTSAS